ncbi:MAG: ABC transporter substrate-binding protein [Anaerolineae bacterium]
MLRKALFLMMLLVLALVPSMAQDAPSGSLVVALPNDPTSLFPPNGADITAGNAARPLYNSLVRLNAEGNLEPELALSWEISEDGREYTFTLREGVTFHNGEPFNAESVVTTWEYSSQDGVAYAQDFAKVISVEVIDEFTVRMATVEPDPIFLTQLATGWAMLPTAYMDEVGIEGFEAAPVGTGAFRFVERIPGDRIVYEANPDYWEEGKPGVQSLTFRIIPDSTTRLAAIQTGEVDIVNRLSIEDVSVLEGSSDVEIINYANDRVYYVAFKNIGNGVGTPLEDVRVRQALNYAVNREGIINGLFGGEAALVTGFVLPSNLGYDDSLEPYPYDPDRARELLAEAGYAEGFEISMGCPTDAYLNINEVCLAIQRDLGQVGIDLSVEFKTSNSFWSQAGYGAVGPMYVDSWSTDLGEAINRLQGALIPGNYYTGWEDEGLVELITRIETTVDRDARAEVYKELQQEMYNNPPFIYLYQPFNFEAVRSRVEGYMPRSNEGYDLTTVTVTE